MLSQIRSTLLLGAAALGGLALTVHSAAAQSGPDGTLEVQATIGEACSVTSASLNFGAAYDGSGLVTQEGSIEISCVTTTPLGIALNGGQAGNGNGIRTMRNANSDPLLYQLFTDPGFSDAWLTGDSVQQTIGTSGSVPVYGQITPVLNPGLPEPGLYTDQVFITLTFL